MPQTVLCIDNDPGLVSSYGIAFASCGYHILLACDGKYGLYLMDRHTVHAVVMDFEIPDMDGAQVIREIARRDRKVPIIVTTVSSCVPADLLGLVGLVIAKPLLSTELLFCIRALTQSAEALSCPVTERSFSAAKTSSVLTGVGLSGSETLRMTLTHLF